MTSHTVSAVDEELTKLRSIVAQMGGLAEALIDGAIDSLVKRDSDAANKVRATDVQIDQLETELEAAALRFLAIRTPVADDLRTVIAALKISNTLERVGDYAANIAKRVTVLNQTPTIRPVSIIPEMGRFAGRLVKDALDSYIQSDDKKALAVWQRDRKLDEMYNSLFRELLTYMMENPSLITPCTHLLFIAKNLERIGDHATNIAEIVHFRVTGQNIEAQRPKGDDTSYTLVEPPADLKNQSES